MKTRLFSDDGIDSSHARREQESVYFPEGSTLDEIKFLFKTLESTQNAKGTNEGVVDIRNLPYSSDLSILTSDTQGNLLSLDDVSLDRLSLLCRLLL